MVEAVLTEITYEHRTNFLQLPKGYDKEDAYPWRFNRKYSFIRRPIMQKGESIIWGNRALYYMLEYLTDLIYSGKYRAKSEDMKSLCGKITKSSGAAFNELIYKVIKDMGCFDVYPNVKKVNGKRIAIKGGDLGDIDLLIIDKSIDKIIVAEVKNFRFSRNPREINIEYEKMFSDKANASSFSTKHERRRKWVEEHLEDFIIEYGLKDTKWKVASLFIVNQSLISQHIYRQNIKCLSRAELSIESIREV